MLVCNINIYLVLSDPQAELHRHQVLHLEDGRGSDRQCEPIELPLLLFLMLFILIRTQKARKKPKNI